MKKIITIILMLALIFSLAGCSGDGPYNEGDTPLYAIPAVEWRDFFADLADSSGFPWEPWDAEYTLELPEFPGVTFTLTALSLTATDQYGTRTLFGGMPIWNVYIADITGSGLPDFAATVSFGSGIVDDRVLVYDFANGVLYGLSDRMNNDYSLSTYNGELIVIRRPHPVREAGEVQKGELAVIDGKLTMVVR